MTTAMEEICVVAMPLLEPVYLFCNSVIGVVAIGNTLLNVFLESEPVLHNRKVKLLVMLHLLSQHIL